MKWLTAVLCCLMFSAAPAIAQVKDGDKKGGMTKEQLAAKKKAVDEKNVRCATEARRRNLKQGSKELVGFMTDCLKP